MKVPGAYFFCAPGRVHLLGCIRSPESAILKFDKQVCVTQLYFNCNGHIQRQMVSFFEKKISFSKWTSS
jgi:hypothetical protein